MGHDMQRSLGSIQIDKPEGRASRMHRRRDIWFLTVLGEAQNEARFMRSVGDACDRAPSVRERLPRKVIVVV